MDANLRAELKKKGILTDPRSLAFYLSTDGVRLFRKGRRYRAYSPRTCFRIENVVCLGILPGPKKPKDLHSLLCPSSTNSSCLLQAFPHWMPQSQLKIGSSARSGFMHPFALLRRHAPHAASLWGFLGKIPGTTAITMPFYTDEVGSIYYPIPLAPRRDCPTNLIGGHTSRFIFCPVTKVAQTGDRVTTKKNGAR